MTNELIPTDADVEAFIASMQWSPDSTEREKTLVICNVRAFAGWVRRRHLPIISDRIQGVDCYLCEDSIDHIHTGAQ